MATIEIKTDIDVDAPVDHVWRKLAKLDDVTLWADSVKTARYASDQTEGVGAGRVCEVDGIGTLYEDIIEWREGEALTYTAEGMPFPVKRAQNTWVLEAITPEHTRVYSRIQIETRGGFIGSIMGKTMLRPQFTKFMRSALQSFKEFAEDGVTRAAPSPEPLHAHVA